MKTIDSHVAAALFNTATEAIQKQKIAQAMADAGSSVSDVHRALFEQLRTFLGNNFAFPEIMAKMREWVTAECGRTQFCH